MREREFAALISRWTNVWQYRGGEVLTEVSVLLGFDILIRPSK